MTSKIKEGCYIATKDIPDTETWEKVIDKFVEAGFSELEGYTEGCETYYKHRWGNYAYVGIDWEGDTMHYNHLHDYHHGMDLNLIQLSLEDILSVDEKPTTEEIKQYKVIRLEASLMSEEDLEERINKICTDNNYELVGVSGGNKFIFKRL